MQYRCGKVNRMKNTRNVTDSVVWIGANDRRISLFENMFPLDRGVSYNSYLILDEKTAVMDTADTAVTGQFLENVQGTLDGRSLDYLVVNHMEPDHCANIETLLRLYPEAKVVGNAKTFQMIGQFYDMDLTGRTVTVKEGDVLDLGSHKLQFVFAPMVHWPEVMMTYESSEKVLFSADGFGKFGALDVEEPWADEARRYYIGIVGKYGKQVQNILKVAATLDIAIICPLHGPVLTENLGYYIHLYDLWSSYTPEEQGIVLCYTSVYGHTAQAVKLLEKELNKRGVPKVVVYDLARCDMAAAVADAFRYEKLVLATTTYNADIFPYMRTFLDKLTERAFQNRTVAFIENGSWAPTAICTMRERLSKCKNLTYCKNEISIRSALSEENEQQLQLLADELAAGYVPVEVEENTIDPTALFHIGYGLYVLTSRDCDGKDNGCIVNTVTQVTNTPNRVAVTVNKMNYSCDVIANTGVLNISTLTEDAPFQLFQHFGFQSGKDVDKFADFKHVQRSHNGLLFLDKYANAYISCRVIDKVDLQTHIMFICDVTECVRLSDKETMTYTYYQKNVKPKPDTGKKGFVCKVCGYVYEGDELPADFICPLCKHGAADFEPIQ